MAVGALQKGLLHKGLSNFRTALLRRRACIRCRRYRAALGAVLDAPRISCVSALSHEPTACHHEMRSLLLCSVGVGQALGVLRTCSKALARADKHRAPPTRVIQGFLNAAYAVVNCTCYAGGSYGCFWGRVDTKYLLPRTVGWMTSTACQGHDLVWTSSISTSARPAPTGTGGIPLWVRVAIADAFATRPRTCGLRFSVGGLLIPASRCPISPPS